MKKWIFCLVVSMLLFAPLGVSASMQKGYPQDKYCLDLEIRSGNTGQVRSAIAQRYPGKMEAFANCSFIRKSTYARKHRRKTTGWGAVGFHVYRGEEDTSCLSGHKRGVFVQSTFVKIGHWDKIKESLPQVINFSTNQLEPYVLCAAEGNLLMKNGHYVTDNQGFSDHERNDPHRRPVVAVKADQTVYLGYMYGSSRQICRRLKKVGFLDAIAFDSGSSTERNALVYDIVGVVDKRSARYQEYEAELDNRTNWTRLLKPAKDGKPAHAPFGDVIFPTRTFTLSGGLFSRYLLQKQVNIYLFLYGRGGHLPAGRQVTSR